MGRVTAVLCAAFDPATDDQVYAVREVVRAAGIALPQRPPHRPHLTMTAARVERGAELDRVVTVARDLASRHASIPLRLTEVGRFGRAGALWLGPQQSAGLVKLQQDAVASIEAAGWPDAFADRTGPRAWVPHCTLATRVPKPQLRDVQQAVRTAFRPIDATVAGVAVILVGGRGDVALCPFPG
jgi:2'-5' RNA ligase